MTTYQSVFHELAKKEYDDAFEWYEQIQTGLGYKFILAVREKVSELLVKPETFGARSNKLYREAKVENIPFSIIYKLYKKESIVFVSSIHHHKKHPKNKYRK